MLSLSERELARAGSAAIHLLEGGAVLRILQDILRHATLASTQIYTYVSVE